MVSHYYCSTVCGTHCMTTVGTQRDVYQDGYEWAAHSMDPTHIDPDDALVDVGASVPQPCVAH